MPLTLVKDACILPFSSLLSHLWKAACILMGQFVLRKRSIRRAGINSERLVEARKLRKNLRRPQTDSLSLSPLLHVDLCGA